MITLGLVAVITPEQTNTLAALIAVLTAMICGGAVLYPIARAWARRLEGGPVPPRLEYDVAELTARLERLEQERLVELENRLDFAERLLSRGRPEPERENTPPAPVGGRR